MSPIADSLITSQLRDVALTAVNTVYKETEKEAVESAVDITLPVFCGGSEKGGKIRSEGLMGVNPRHAQLIFS